MGYRRRRTRGQAAPPRWFVLHGDRCLAGCVEKLGARDSIVVDAQDLLGVTPRRRLLQAMIPGLAARGIGLEADARFPGPSFARTPERRSLLVLFRLPAGKVEGVRPRTSVDHAAARLFLQVALGILPLDATTLAAVDAVLTQQVDLSPRETVRVRMYFLWMVAQRPPLKLGRLFRWLPLARRKKLLALIDALVRTHPAIAHDARAKLLGTRTKLDLDRPVTPVPPIRRSTSTPVVRSPPPPRLPPRAPAPAPARDPAAPAPARTDWPLYDDDPPVVLDRKRLRIRSSHRAVIRER